MLHDVGVWDHSNFLSNMDRHFEIRVNKTLMTAENENVESRDRVASFKMSLNRDVKRNLFIFNTCMKRCFDGLNKLTMRAVRITMDVEKTMSSNFLFNTLKWGPFTKQSFIKRETLTFKRVNNAHCTPSYLDSFLRRSSGIHKRNTRYLNLNMLCLTSKRKTEGGRSFSVRTIIDWKRIDINVREKLSVSCFKQDVYNQFLNEKKAVNHTKRYFLIY